MDAKGFDRSRGRPRALPEWDRVCQPPDVQMSGYSSTIRATRCCRVLLPFHTPSTGRQRTSAESKCSRILGKMRAFSVCTLCLLSNKDQAVFVNVRCDTIELDGTIAQAMNMLGPLLSQSLARNIGGNASRSELDKLTEPLKKLIVRYPMAKSWLESGLSHSSFPSTRVTRDEKSIFLKKIIRYPFSLECPVIDRC